MKQALHIKNLTKKYKDFTLDHISLDLPYGMILGLIGENGSGKSTLINSILNIVKADYDEVHILGQDLKSQEKEIKKDLEQDEKVNFDKIQLTFPITKTEIVLSKYILGICFLTICNVFSLIFVFSFTSSHNKITLQEGLSAWGFGVLFSLVFFAVVNFAFFLLGRKLGLIVYIFIAMLFGGIYGAVSSLKGMEFLMAGDKTMIFIIGIPIGILFVVISFFLSLACYKKRYS